MKWDFITIVNDEGKEVTAQCPLIISASRSTDIPAFYADWFVERWKKGYVSWKNPFNFVSMNVSFEKTRLVVFWTKNCRPIFKHLSFLDDNIINYYFQHSLNDYDKEKLEGNVPHIDYRIDSFIKLSEHIGKEKNIWRFDPMILTDKIGVDELLKKAENIGDKIKNHTQKLVISFADIEIYPKVKNNLIRENINYTEFTIPLMEELAIGIQELNKKWNFEISTCSEIIELDKFGISHNKCIDDDLISKCFSEDKKLMEFIGYEYEVPSLFDLPNKNTKKKILKDKGQRETCGCIMSKDIGQYNTCPHGCVYCYANTSKISATNNYNLHKSNPFSESIIGK